MCIDRMFAIACTFAVIISVAIPSQAQDFSKYPIIEEFVKLQEEEYWAPLAQKTSIDYVGPYERGIVGVWLVEEIKGGRLPPVFGFNAAQIVGTFLFNEYLTEQIRSDPEFTKFDTFQEYFANGIILEDSKANLVFSFLLYAILATEVDEARCEGEGARAAQRLEAHIANILTSSAKGIYLAADAYKAADFALKLENITHPRSIRSGLCTSATGNEISIALSNALKKYGSEEAAIAAGALKEIDDPDRIGRNIVIVEKSLYPKPKLVDDKTFENERIDIAKKFYEKAAALHQLMQ